MGRGQCTVGGEKSFLTHPSPAPVMDCSPFADELYACPPLSLCISSSIGQECPFPISLSNTSSFATTWLRSFSESSHVCSHSELFVSASVHRVPIPKGRNKLPHAIVLSKSYTEGPGQGMRGSCREVPTLLSEQCCVSAEGALFPLP